MTTPTPDPSAPTAKRSLGVVLRGLLSSKWIRFALRWGVFVIGVVWIVSKLTIRDRVNVVMPDLTVQSIALSERATEDSTLFHLEGYKNPVARDRIVSQPDRKTVKMFDPTDPRRAAVIEVPLWGLHLRGELSKSPQVDALIVKNPKGTGGLRLTPIDIAGGFDLRTPRPVVEKGLPTMIREADPWLLALAIGVFPITMLISTIRWNEILRSQEVRLPIRRVFVLNMVGNFYNSFLPGSTGGDFAKAFYVSRQTPHKIRAILSVFMDRVIGLLALVILGGSISGYQYLFLSTPGSPTSEACKHVAFVCLIITIGAGVGGLLMMSARLRRAVGFNWVLTKLPMQHHLTKVRESATLYRRHVLRFAWWIALTFPIHVNVVISAIIAGRAFNLPIAPLYYFVCVPVMVLVAAMPISPQGAGVMEGVGFLLLAKQGATVSDVLALTLSIRFVQLLWNLVGGVFVLGGEFNAPQSTSFDQIADEEEPPEADLPSVNV